MCNHIIFSKLKNIHLCHFIFYGQDFYLVDDRGDGFSISSPTIYPDGWGVEIIHGSMERGCGEMGWTNGNGSYLEIAFSFCHKVLDD